MLYYFITLLLYLMYYVKGFFAAIKKRFRELDNGVLYHSPIFIEDAFKAATTLHNMVLLFDGRASFDHRWENVQWENIHPDEDEMDFDDEFLSPVPNISGVTVPNDFSQDQDYPEEPDDQIRVIDPMSSKRSFKVLYFIIIHLI